MDEYLKVVERDNQNMVIVMAGAGETVVYAPAKSFVSDEITQLAADMAAQTYEHKKGLKRSPKVKVGTVMTQNDLEAEIVETTFSFPKFQTLPFLLLSFLFFVPKRFQGV